MNRYAQIVCNIWLKMKIPNKVVKFWLFVEVFLFGRGVRKTFQRGKKVLTTLELGKLMTQMLPGCLEYGTLHERIKAKRHLGEGRYCSSFPHKNTISENFFKSPPICRFLPLWNVLIFHWKLLSLKIFFIRYSLEIIWDLFY